MTRIPAEPSHDNTSSQPDAEFLSPNAGVEAGGHISPQDQASTASQDNRHDHGGYSTQPVDSCKPHHRYATQSTVPFNITSPVLGTTSSQTECPLVYELGTSTSDSDESMVDPASPARQVEAAPSVQNSERQPTPKYPSDLGSGFVGPRTTLHSTEMSLHRELDVIEVYREAMTLRERDNEALQKAVEIEKSKADKLKTELEQSQKRQAQDLEKSTKEQQDLKRAGESAVQRAQGLQDQLSKAMTDLYLMPIYQHQNEELSRKMQEVWDELTQARLSFKKSAKLFTELETNMERYSDSAQQVEARQHIADTDFAQVKALRRAVQRDMLRLKLELTKAREEKPRVEAEATSAEEGPSVRRSNSAKSQQLLDDQQDRTCSMEGVESVGKRRIADLSEGESTTDGLRERDGARVDLTAEVEAREDQLVDQLKKEEAARSATLNELATVQGAIQELQAQLDKLHSRSRQGPLQSSAQIHATNHQHKRKSQSSVLDHPADARQLALRPRFGFDIVGAVRGSDIARAIEAENYIAKLEEKVEEAKANEKAWGNVFKSMHEEEQSEKLRRESLQAQLEEMTNYLEPFRVELDDWKERLRRDVSDVYDAKDVWERANEGLENALSKLSSSAQRGRVWRPSARATMKERFDGQGQTPDPPRAT
ncbi:Uu.00g063510.m01.CDS01 [Anthostomella pinea]|uniref:Uu.00g063510.m01.CDS01 n=1 Tax=Anthostomella pinea TaxID=933095 RepID=A0AAI8VTD6_9PEZI|nr:Uu.00g063510.m01.CDS01 [Anthostomella pinea]